MREGMKSNYQRSEKKMMTGWKKKKEKKKKRGRACGEEAERRSFLKVKYISRSNAKQSFAGGNGEKEAPGS